MNLKSIISLGALICVLTFVNAQVTNEGTPLSWQKNIPEITSVKMPAFDLNTLIEEDKVNDQRKDIPYRFGYKFDTDYNIQNSGEWTTLENGDRIWRMRFVSPGAKSINFILEDFFLPIGGKIYLYNQDRTDLVGAYTFTQNNKSRILGTWIVKGEDVTLEYFEPASQKGKGSFSIANVTHGYRIADGTKGLNTSGNCNIDVNCPIGEDADPLKDHQKKAVAFILSNGMAWCSGALINNTANDRKPYLLTANHCYNNPANWAFRFNWISPNPVCATTQNSTTNDDYMTISGATLKARRAASDFCLVELNSEIPDDWDVVWSGWDRTMDVSPWVFGIHHPDGDIMKTCRDSNPVSTDYTTDRVWRINDWEMGVTEGGSSGSPLYNSDGRIIGQLWRGTAACSGTNDNGGYDEYGRFNVSWETGGTPSTQLKDWLDPLNTGVTILDSYPLPIIYENDAAISITGISSQICGTIAQPSVIVRNAGSETLTSATIKYKLNSETETTINWTGNLNKNETETVPLGDITVTDMDNTFTATISEPNEEDDENPINNNSVYHFSRTEEYAGNKVIFKLKPDNYGSETTWNIKNYSGTVIASGGPYTDSNTTEITKTINLENDNCYTFTIYDSYGDGICCSYGNGSFSLKLPDGTVLIEGGNFGAEDSKAFTMINTLAINESSKTDLQQVHPNPSKGIFNIQVNNSGKDKTEYEVFSAAGSLVKKGNFSGNLGMVDLSGKPAGIYILKINKGEKSLKAIKLIKQ